MEKRKSGLLYQMAVNQMTGVQLVDAATGRILADLGSVTERRIIRPDGSVSVYLQVKREG